MATAKTVPFANFILKIGNGADPEVFAPVGACTTRDFKSKLTTGSTDVPDDADDGAVMYPEQEGKSLQFEVTADGVYSLAGAAVLRAAHLAAVPVSVQLVIAETLANDGGMYAGAAMLTELSFGAKKAEKTTAAVTLSSSGAYAWVPASA